MLGRQTCPECERASRCSLGLSSQTPGSVDLGIQASTGVSGVYIGVVGMCEGPSDYWQETLFRLERDVVGFPRRSFQVNSLHVYGFAGSVDGLHLCVG